MPQKKFIAKKREAKIHFYYVAHKRFNNESEPEKMICKKIIMLLKLFNTSLLLYSFEMKR